MDKKKCIIIGASPETDIEVIRPYINEGCFIACADGGHAFAQQLGVIPDLIVGDFDSGSITAAAGKRVISLPVKKDDTDTVALVRECLKPGFDEFLLFGMTGGRFDHTLANLSVLFSLAKQGKTARMIDRHSCTQVIISSKTVILGKKGCGFGIFPYACEGIKVSLRGFEYELEEGSLTADYPVGVSNTIVSDSAAVEIFSGTAVIVITE